MGGRISPPLPGAIDALRLLARHRAVFVVTARPRIWLPAVARWVTDHSGLEARVDTDPTRAYWLDTSAILVTSTKLGAAAYVDDRAVHHTGDWTTTLATLSHAIGLNPAASSA